MKLLSYAVTAVLTLTTTAFADHPSDLLEARYDLGYNSYVGDSSWNQGELKFFAKEERVPLEHLSEPERYMSAGGFRQDGILELPWYIRVVYVIDAYYTNFGELPDTLDAAAIRTIPGFTNRTDAELDWYRSPVSGDWIHPNDPSPIAGNIYWQPLSTPEKIYLSQFEADFKRSWFHDLEFSKERYEQGYAYIDCFTKVEPISGEVWYFRMYGENGVLMAGTTYMR